MEFEKLSLEVGALKAGLATVDPRVLQGVSGVEHRFDLLFTDGHSYFAFDFYESVTTMDVIRTFAKKFDSKATVNIVSRSGGADGDARSLAAAYGMRILTPDAVEGFFALEKVAPRHAFG